VEQGRLSHQPPRVDFDTTVIVGEVPLDPAVTYQYLVGLAYLVIGLSSISAAAARRRPGTFMCCAWRRSSSFASTTPASSTHSTRSSISAPGRRPVGAGRVPAFLLTFPEPRKWLHSRFRVALLYLPSALLFAVFVAFATGALTVAIPLLELRWMLDRIWMVFWTIPYVAGGFALSVEYRKAEDPIVRQQLKWLRNGLLRNSAFRPVLRAALRHGRDSQRLLRCRCSRCR